MKNPTTWRLQNKYLAFRNNLTSLLKLAALLKNLVVKYLYLSRLALLEWRDNGWRGLIFAIKRHLTKRSGARYKGYPRGRDYQPGLVTVAILTINRLDLIKPCIESIEKNLSEKYQVEILIGDTGSTEPSVWEFYDRAKQEYGNINLVRCSHYWFSYSYNRLIIKNANGQFLILLNNDTIVTGRWIDNLIDPLDDRRIGIVGGKLLYGDGTIQHAGIEFDENGHGIHAHKRAPRDLPGANYKAFVPAVTFACVAMRHDTFDRFQLSEVYRVEAQDTDFCLRLAEGGYKVLYNHEVEVYHLECSSRDWRRGHQDRRLLKEQWGNKIKQLASRGNQRTRFDENEYRDSITIIRDDGIGDLLMGISAFKKLKEKHPEKKLILATYQRNIEMLAGFNIFHEFIPIPDGEKYAPFPVPKDAEIHDFIGMEMDLGHVWGITKEENKVHRHFIYSRELGLDRTFQLVPMPEYPEARSSVLQLFEQLDIDINQEFVVLNLLSMNPARSWWEPYYPNLIKAIEEMGFVPVVVGNKKSNYFKGKKLVNLVRKTRTIPEYIEVVKLGRYVISTDTSAYHIAALSGIPFLAIFTGGMIPEARVNLYEKYEVVEPPAHLGCYPCWDEGCKDLTIRSKNDPCRTSIPPEEVIAKFRNLVAKYPADTERTPCPSRSQSRNDGRRGA